MGELGLPTRWADGFWLGGLRLLLLFHFPGTRKGSGTGEEGGGLGCVGAFRMVVQVFRIWLWCSFKVSSGGWAGI